MRASAGRAAALVALLAATSMLASGCGLQLRAVQIKVEVEDGTMRLVEPLDGRFRGGETVITIVNATSSRRQFTLARTGATPKHIPADILEAYSSRDDSSVVAVTGVMRSAQMQFQFGSIPRPQPTEVKMHVYIRPNTPYLLFDRLGGYRNGVALKLEATK